MNKKWCVYLHIVHSSCGHDKYYVGITSASTKRRWGKDGNGYKNQIFYRAIEKYGWENIEHIILEKNLSECEAKELEKEYIKKYNSFNKEYGYNLTLGGDGSVGREVSNETRRKISNSLSGEKHPMYGKHHTEEYKQYMREINIGKKMSEIDKKKLSDRKISKYKNGIITPPMENKHHTDDSKQKISNNKIGKNLGKDSVRSKNIYQYSLDGKYLNHYYGAMEAERLTGINHSLITACCRGERKRGGKYMWNYEKNDKIKPYESITNPGRKVNQYDKNRNFLNTFNNIHEAHIVTGANEQNISACCRGVRKMCGGYIWEYAS